MKKILIIVFTFMLFMMVSCSNNTSQEDTTIYDPFVYDVMIYKFVEDENTIIDQVMYNQNQFSFRYLEEMENFYEYCIKKDGYNYAYIEYDRSRAVFYESWRISFSNIVDGIWNDVYFYNYCEYRDSELGYEFPHYSMTILCVSFLYAGNLSENLVIEHNETTIHGYNYEVNIYSEDRLIITLWYSTKLDIPVSYIESMITNGINEL